MKKYHSVKKKWGAVIFDAMIEVEVMLSEVDQE